MAEAFLAAAWAAGVVEGGSVLSNAAKKEGAVSTPLILVPSLLYGTLSLPMGLVGASPGPSIMSLLPFVPSFKALEESNTSMQSSLSDDNHSSAPIKSSSSSSTTRETETWNQENENMPPITTRTEMIRKVREDNKRSLVARKQRQNTLPAAPPPPPTKRNAARLFSTLDGRPLPTPLAEAMRRSRFMFVGAGLVMATVSCEQAQREKKEFQKTKQLRQRRQGRDVPAIQSLVSHGDTGRNGSVVVRLVGRRNNLVNVTSSNGTTIVPLLCPVTLSDDIDVPTFPTEENDAPPAYWNLGTTMHAWKETPLTNDWLFRPNKQDQPAFSSLVLEADVCSSPLSEYFSHQGDAPLSFDRAMFASNILGLVAREKGVLDDNETVNVLIGSDKKQALSENSNVIYIHGPSAVGVEVVSQLERMQNEISTSTTVDEKGAPVEETTPVSPVKEAAPVDPVKEAAPADLATVPLPFPKTVNEAVSLLEFVGMMLRQGGELTVTAVTKIFAEGDKVVQVLSDQPATARWLERIMAPTGSSIVWHDPTSGMEEYRTIAANKESVSFVCCGNDEATCSLICSLVTGEHEVRVVALVEEQSCASTLKALVAELNNKASIEILSVKGIHSRLFDQARDLLAKGKTPSEVQELMYLIQ